jgi:hypothetical protein
MSHVSGGWLLENLELSDEELGGICRYLEGEHLITAGPEYWGHHTPFMIVLTRAGIEEMRRSRQAPDQATGHFPPISVIHSRAMPSALLSRPAALEPTRVSLPVTSTWTRFARSWPSSRPGQPACIFLTATPGSFARTWRRSGFRPACPRRITTPSAGTFSRRARSSNTPPAQRRPAASLICFGTCIFEGAKRLIATRVDDRSRRTKVPVIVHATIDPAARPLDLHGPPVAAFTPGQHRGRPPRATENGAPWPVPASARARRQDPSPDRPRPWDRARWAWSPASQDGGRLPPRRTRGTRTPSRSPIGGLCGRGIQGLGWPRSQLRGKDAAMCCRGPTTASPMRARVRIASQGRAAGEVAMAGRAARPVVLRWCSAWA